MNPVRPARHRMLWLMTLQRLWTGFLNRTVNGCKGDGFVRLRMAGTRWVVCFNTRCCFVKNVRHLFDFVWLENIHTRGRTHQ